MEDFATDFEAIANVASLYNNSNMTVSNINVTQNAVMNTATVNGELNVGSLNILPRGIIVSWTGTSAPGGWAICDGNNGTPDLRGRFVLGFNPGGGKHGAVPGDDFNVFNGKGGDQIHTLNINEIPPHSHQTGGPIRSDMRGDYYQNIITRERGGIWADNSGGGGPHNNMPPYYILAYIMKL